VRILVTGGAGFIGSHVVDAYLAEGHDVAVIDDLSTGKEAFLNPKARFYRCDIRSREIADVFQREKPEIVNHLAAQIDVRKSVTEPMFDADVNILGGINLLEHSVKAAVRKFIFASTGGAIYGEPEVLPASEETPPRPKSHYAASKLAFEHYLGLYERLYGLPYTVLRFPNVYGPRQSPEGEAGVCSILSGLMLADKTPQLFGYGEPTRDYVYVGDIAAGNVLALDRGENEIINLGSGVGVSVQTLFEAIARIIGFEGEAVLKPLRQGEVMHTYITGDKAAELLGWRPATSLDQGLEATVAYVAEQERSASA